MRGRDLGRRGHHEGRADAAEPLGRRPRAADRDAGRPVHPVPDGGSQLRLPGARPVGEGPRHARRAAGRLALRERRAARRGGERRRARRQAGGRRGLRARERLPAADAPDAGRRHRPHDRGRRLRREHDDVQRAARPRRRVHARLRLRRPAADRRDHAHLRPLDGGGRPRQEGRRPAVATTSPRCSIRSSTT